MYKSCSNCCNTVPIIDYDLTNGVCSDCKDKLFPIIKFCKACEGKGKKIYGKWFDWLDNTEKDHVIQCKTCRGTGKE